MNPDVVVRIGALFLGLLGTHTVAVLIAYDRGKRDMSREHLKELIDYLDSSLGSMQEYHQSPRQPGDE